VTEALGGSLSPSLSLPSLSLRITTGAPAPSVSHTLSLPLHSRGGGGGGGVPVASPSVASEGEEGEGGRREAVPKAVLDLNHQGQAYLAAGMVGEAKAAFREAVAVMISATASGTSADISRPSSPPPSLSPSLSHEGEEGEGGLEDSLEMSASEGLVGSAFSPEEDSSATAVEGDLLRLIRDSATADPNVTTLLSNLATCYRRDFERLRKSGEEEEAEREWKAARVLFEAALQRKVDLLSHEDLTVANVKSHLGRLHKAYDNLSLAIAYYAEAQQAQELLLGPSSKPVADSLNNVGLALHERLQRSKRIIEERERAYNRRVRENLPVEEKNEEEERERRGRLTQRGIDAEDRETYFDEQRDIEAAESNLCQAVAIYSQLATEDGSTAESKEDLANALGNLSAFYLYHSRHSEALEFLDHLRRLTEEERGECLLLARVQRDISRCCLSARRYDDATVALKRSFELYESELGPDHPTTAEVRASLEELSKDGRL